MYKFVVLSCLVAVASASGLFGPIAYSAYSAPYAYSPISPYAYSYYGPSNYRGPLSLAPGQPANILGADGRPLDTLDVNLDRSAHLAAKAYGGHILKKRSAPLPYFAPGFSSVGFASPYLGNQGYAYAPAINPAGFVAPIGAYPYASTYTYYKK